MHALVLFLALWSSPSLAMDQELYEKYAASAYTYCDAEAVAAAFKISQTDAKVYIGQKIANQLTGFLDTTIKEQRAARPERFCSETGVGAVAAAPSAPPPSEAGFPKVIDHCHGKMLAPIWGLSPSESKTLAGTRAFGSDAAVRATFARDLAQGRNKLANGLVECSFGDTAFQYEDAARVAKAWGTSVEEAKVMIVNKYKWGSENNVASIR